VQSARHEIVHLIVTFGHVLKDGADFIFLGSDGHRGKAKVGRRLIVPNVWARNAVDGAGRRRRQEPVLAAARV